MLHSDAFVNGYQQAWNEYGSRNQVPFYFGSAESTASIRWRAFADEVPEQAYVEEWMAGFRLGERNILDARARAAHERQRWPYVAAPV